MKRRSSVELPKEAEGVSIVEVPGKARDRVYSKLALTWNGETKTLDEWAKETGIPKQTLYYRSVKMKWPVSEVLTRKPMHERHGMTGTTEHHLWLSMKQRCNDQDCKGYERYGGRGIKVCKEWEESFQAFFDYMGKRPSDEHSLERRDNSKGYEPGNVIWATGEVQVRNTRKNVRLTHDGRTMILKDWAREVGLSNTTLWNRIFTLGWDAAKALTTPAGKNGRKG